MSSVFGNGNTATYGLQNYGGAPAATGDYGFDVGSSAYGGMGNGFMEYGAQAITPTFGAQGLSPTDLASPYATTATGANNALWGDFTSMLGGVGSGIQLGGAIAGLVQNGKQLQLNKDAYQTTLDMYNQNNQINAQQYNTRLADRQASRSSALNAEEMNRYYGDNYLAENSLNPEKVG